MTPSLDAMVKDLISLVEVESPSNDLPALHRCAEQLCRLATERTGLAVERMEIAGRPVVRIGRFDAPILLLGHLDTVHPIGSLERAPCRVIANRMTGPGVLDMKSGLVIALHSLTETSGASLLVTSDEELGSPSSRELIEIAATGKVAVLVPEPAAGRSLKIARKGVARYVVELSGKAAHAGLEPGLGANALIGMSNAVLATAALSDVDRGTTVTPTLATAGTSSNTVPETASFNVDVRTWVTSEACRVDQGLRALDSRVDGVEIHLVEGPNRPPFQATASATLFEMARQVAGQLGLGSLQGESVGGGSDGNLTAALGIPTLDGLGGVGGGAHTVHEWLDVGSLVERCNLLTALISRCNSQSRN